MDLNELLKQAQQLQASLSEKQDELESKSFEVDTNGVIKITITGKMKITDIQIDPELLNDKDMLQDMLLVATNKAIDKVLDEQNKISSDMTSAYANKMPRK